MNRRSGDKRPRRFWGILSDPWRKLVSIVLALLLWYYLNAQITKELDVEVPLLFNSERSVNHVTLRMNSIRYGKRQFLNGDTREPLTEITLYLEGPNRLIEDAKKPGQMVFEVNLLEGDVNQTNPPFIVFGLEDLHHKHNVEYDRIIRRMQPRTIRVELQRNDDKYLPLTRNHVSLQVSGIDAKAFDQRIRKVEFSPLTITLFGPKEELDKIEPDSRLFTAKIGPRDVEGKTEVVLQLDLAADIAARGIEIKAPPTATYTLDPVRNIFLLKRVPVVLDTTRVGADAARGYVVEPAYVDFKIAASGDLERALINHYQAALPLSEVPAEWSEEHARFRVVLRPEETKTSNRIIRTPTIHLFTLDPFDKEELYRLGPDYSLPDGELPTIEIKKKPGD